MKSTDDHKNRGLVSTSSSSSILVLPSNFLDVTTSLLELSDLVFCWVHVAHPAQWITSVEQLHFCRGDEHWKGPLYTAHAQQTCTQDKQCNTLINCLGRSQQLTGFPHISTGAFRASALGEQAVPPGQLPLHQHHGHTQTCKQSTRTGEWAIIKLQTLGLDLHIFVCRQIHTWHACWLWECFCTCMCRQVPRICMSWARFLSLSLFLSSLNGKRLSAISFCQQLGDAFLQLAAICFNYVY